MNRYEENAKLSTESVSTRFGMIEIHELKESNKSTETFGRTVEHYYPQQYVAEFVGGEGLGVYTAHLDKNPEDQSRICYTQEEVLHTLMGEFAKREAAKIYDQIRQDFGEENVIA